jgi:hypothetical protein
MTPFIRDVEFVGTTPRIMRPSNVKNLAKVLIGVHYISGCLIEGFRHHEYRLVEQASLIKQLEFPDGALVRQRHDNNERRFLRDSGNYSLPSFLGHDNSTGNLCGVAAGAECQDRKSSTKSSNE